MSNFTSLNIRSFLFFVFCYLGIFTNVWAEETPAVSGKVSYYADYFTGQRTANGEYYKPDEYTCAHTFYPFGTLLKLKKGKRAVIVRVNDRGPFVGDRVLDVSYIAAKELGIVSSGVAEVGIELFDPTFYDTSDTILLAKVLSPDDKRFKLAMNVAKIEREAKQKEKIAELEAKNAAKKGKKKGKEKKEEVVVKDKKEEKADKKNKNVNLVKEVDKKAEKSSKKEKGKSAEKELTKVQKEKKEKKNNSLSKETKKQKQINTEVAENEVAEKVPKTPENEPNTISKSAIENNFSSNEKKIAIVDEKCLEETKKVSNFASDISSTPHKKSSKWWIFPWVIAIVGLIFGVVFKNRD